MASPRSPERGRPELALAQEGKTSEVSEDFGSLAAEITVRNLRVRPTLPFAGTSVPAEGVLHFVAAMLQSRTLEDGLRVLLDALIGDNAIQAGLWVWPEPAVVAIGLIGTARLYEVRSHEPASVPPPQEILVEWTQRARPVEWTPRSVRPETNGPGGPFYITSPLGTVGAICLPSTTPPLSTDAQLWYGTWLEWLATREQTLRDAKLQSLAEFAAGAGHEINNPLGTILGRSQLLLRQETDPERRRWLAAIGGQALRIRDMISDTMVFARPPASKPRTVEIEPLIHSVTDRFAEELLSSGIQLRLNMGESRGSGVGGREPGESDQRSAFSVQSAPPPSTPPSHPQPSTLYPQRSLLLDPEQFQVVLIELLRNAIRAVGKGGRIGLRVRNRTWQGRDWLELDLFNNGPELTPAEREHAFDPFFSGRDAGRGLGFGLTKCWSIVTSHGGRIGVHSTPEQTVFRTLWPLSPAASP